MLVLFYLCMLKSGFAKRPRVEFIDQKLKKGREKALQITHGHVFGHGPEQPGLVKTCFEHSVGPGGLSKSLPSLNHELMMS